MKRSAPRPSLDLFAYVRHVRDLLALDTPPLAGRLRRTRDPRAVARVLSVAAREAGEPELRHVASALGHALLTADDDAIPYIDRALDRARAAQRAALAGGAQ